MWYAIGGALFGIFVFVAYQTVKPGLKRKKAIGDALARARAAVQAEPSNVHAKVRLARVHLEVANEGREALAILEPIAAAEPHQWLEGEKPTRMLVAECHVAEGRLERAIEILQSFVDEVGRYETGGDKERKWKLETHKVDAEQRIRNLKKGDTHVHGPEVWGDTA